MAKQMSYTADIGATFAQSYWRPVQVVLDVGAKTARIVFHGYADAAARQADKAPIGFKTYTVGSDAYDTYFTTAALQASNPCAIAYQIADVTLDTGGASFFNGATDI